MIRLILLFGLAFLQGCANTEYVAADPTNKDEVLSKIYTIKSDFEGDVTYGPIIREEFGNVLNTDTVSVQLLKSEDGVYLLKLHNYYYYDGRTKNIESITTSSKQTFKFVGKTKESKLCVTDRECSYVEVGYIPISKDEYLAGNNGFKIRLNSYKYGGQVIAVPVEYIKAFVEKTGS